MFFAAIKNDVYEAVKHHSPPIERPTRAGMAVVRPICLESAVSILFTTDGTFGARRQP